MGPASTNSIAPSRTPVTPGPSRPVAGQTSRGAVISGSISSLDMFEFKRRIQTKHCMPGNSIAFATETSRRSVDRLRTRALKKYGGAAGNRTPDLVIANDALSQLSYSPPARTSLPGFPPDTSDIGRAGIEFRTFSA